MAAIAFSGSVGGTFAPGIGVVTPTVASPTPTEPILLSLGAYARLTLDIPAPVVPAPVLLALKQVSVAPAPFVVANGLPRQPGWWGKAVVSATVLQGLGHLREFPDPDPVWNGASWDVPPPAAPAGSHFMRWTARDLPDPGAHGGRYELGARSATDGTAGLPAGAEQWSAAGGSDFAISWRSAYPFKPSVAPVEYFNPDGSKLVTAAGVHCTTHSLQHMWADFGTVLTPPFTLLWVGLITHFPTETFRCHVFDAGNDPTGAISAATRKAWLTSGVVGTTAIAESYGYRTSLQVSRSHAQVFNDEVPTTRMGLVPFAHTLRPKMLFMVINGANSMLGVYSASVGPHRAQIKTMKLANHGAQRLTLLGRQNGEISRAAGSSMVTLEMRAWDAPLTTDHLDAQYAQLSSTWKFAGYR